VTRALGWHGGFASSVVVSCLMRSVKTVISVNQITRLVFQIPRRVRLPWDWSGSEGSSLRVGLAAGKNTLAVQLQNYFEQGWDDLSFDVALKANFYGDYAPKINSVQRSGNNAIVNMSSGAGNIMRLESTDKLQDLWKFVDSITNLGGQNISIIDFGQNGRPLPSAVTNRFYRVTP
jgi:hypothetical protein